MVQVIKVTSKGQVTIPSDFRENLGIDQDSYLVVDRIGDYLVMKKAEVKLQEISSLFQKAAKDKKVTRKDIEEAILKAREEVWSDE